MLKILISNDDGVYAPGLLQLAEAVKAFAEITVVAPDRNRSGASNSLTLTRPLRINKTPDGYYMVDGTPSDCVHVAITGFLDDTPDMVISGINAGANLGDDVIYSGTVAAATEARFLGIPAIAFSLASRQTEHFETAAKVAVKVIKQIHSSPLPSDCILNVNIPDIPYDEINGFEVTRCGHRHCAEGVVREEDPRGLPIYWIGEAGPEQDAGKGTDFYAINKKCVSITPLQVDLTKHEALDSLHQWVEEELA